VSEQSLAVPQNPLGQQEGKSLEQHKPLPQSTGSFAGHVAAQLSGEHVPPPPQHSPVGQSVLVVHVTPHVSQVPL
jgi:hypothetical protein